MTAKKKGWRAAVSFRGSGGQQVTPMERREEGIRVSLLLIQADNLFKRPSGIFLRAVLGLQQKLAESAEFPPALCPPAGPLLPACCSGVGLCGVCCADDLIHLPDCHPRPTASVKAHTTWGRHYSCIQEFHCPTNAWCPTSPWSPPHSWSFICVHSSALSRASRVGALQNRPSHRMMHISGSSSSSQGTSLLLALMILLSGWTIVVHSPPAEGRLGCLQVLTIMNTASVNICLWHRHNFSSPLGRD